MRINYFLILMAALLVLSCNEDAGSAGKAENTEQSPAETRSQPAARWQVNPEMMVHVVKVDEELSAFEPAREQADLGDYQKLGDRIAAHTDKLINACTMKGEAHDALHEWLMPFMESTKKLQKSGSEEEAKQHFEQLQLAMKDFRLRFQ